MEKINLGRDIHITANQIARKLDSATHHFDITHTQFHILCFLSEHKGDTYQKDIEISFNLRRSTVSKALSLLEKKGLLEKQSVERDARLKKIVLTQKGIDLLKLVRITIDDTNSQLIADIDPEELKIFYKVLNQLSKAAAK